MIKLTEVRERYEHEVDQSATLSTIRIHWEGVFEYDPAGVRHCSLTVTIPVSGLAVDEPFMRQRLGFDKPMSDQQRREIDSSMRDQGQLYAARYPTIEFQSETCLTDPDHRNRLRIELRATIRGQTASTTIPVAVSFRADQVEAWGDFEMTHADFGFEPYSAFFGAVRNSEEINFFFQVRGQSFD
ncbi:MAG: YceI family protein [Bradymonadaceae bacterium]